MLTHQADVFHESLTNLGTQKVGLISISYDFYRCRLGSCDTIRNHRLSQIHTDSQNVTNVTDDQHRFALFEKSASSLSVFSDFLESGRE